MNSSCMGEDDLPPTHTTPSSSSSSSDTSSSYTFSLLANQRFFRNSINATQADRTRSLMCAEHTSSRRAKHWIPNTEGITKVLYSMYSVYSVYSVYSGYGVYSVYSAYRYHYRSSADRQQGVWRWWEGCRWVW